MAAAVMVMLSFPQAWALTPAQVAYKRNVALTWAARRGNLTEVREMLDQGADPNYQFGSTGLLPCLLNAVMGGNKDIVSLLLERGANPKAATNEPLVYAAVKTGEADIVRMLLDHGADPNRKGGIANVDMHDTPLMIASGWAPDDAGYPLFLRRTMWGGWPGQPTRQFELKSAGDEEVVRLLLDHGADPNLIGGSGRTALINASAGGNTAIMDLLISHGANPNLPQKDGSTALIWAIRYKQQEALRMLLAHGASCKVTTTGPLGRDALGWAASNGNVEILKLVLGCDGTGNLSAALAPAVAMNPDPEVIRTLINAGADVKESAGGLLATTVRRGNLDIVRLLLSKGLNPNEEIGGQTALMSAVLGGNSDIVSALIAAGAHLNAQDQQGQTALFKAVAWGKPNVLKQLLDAGADANLGDMSGVLPILEATYKGDADMVAMLIKHGVKVNVEGRAGLTPLVEAAADGRQKIVQFLIARGADPNLATQDGSTAYDCALTRQIQSIVSAAGGKAGRGCGGGR